MRRVRFNFKDPCWYSCFKGGTITFDFLSESNHDKRGLEIHEGIQRCLYGCGATR